MTTAYPLSWPQGVPRTKVQERSRFQTGLEGALKNVRSSLVGFSRDSGKEVTGIVISSNVSLGETSPRDPGIAVWFSWDGMGLCIAVDRYKSPAENLQAVHHIIEARRTELRHGTLAMVRQTFMGFKSLPPPPGKKNWWEVLGVGPDASREEITAAHRRLATKAHPDSGGSHDAMAALNAAKEEALK